MATLNIIESIGISITLHMNQNGFKSTPLKKKNAQAPNKFENQFHANFIH